jgi:hypothetical protein
MSIQAKIGAVLGGAVAIVLVIAAMWGWQHAQQLIGEARDPQRALWAVRSASVGAAAAAQLVLMTFVVGGIYERRGQTGEILRLTVAVLLGMALIGAVVLAFAGK